MTELQKDSLKFLTNGFLLGLVNDLRPKGKFNFLQNIRVFREGILESRPVVEDFLTLESIEPIHDIKTILNKANNSFLRIVGAGNKLFTGNAIILMEKDSGYSGKALFMVDFRPEQSVEAYLYIADENKFVKISVSDLLSDVGITAPTKAANWALVKPEYKIIDKIAVGSDADWNNLTGSASAPTLQVRVDTTITAYLADGALPNFVSIIPVSMVGIQQGSIVTIAGQDIIVEEVLPAAIGAGIATINKISYDFGVAGLATIVLSVSSPEIKRNSILLLGGTEYVRVEDVTRDSNNIPSIRVTTIGTFAAGATVSGVSAFRIFTPIAFAPGNTIKNDAIKTEISVAGISSITRNVNVDLLNTGVAGKALNQDSILHASVIIDPTKIVEMQIQLGIDGFDQNFYYYAISPNFLTASAAQTTPTLAVIQQTIQREDLLQQARDIYSRTFRLDDIGNIYDRGERGYLLPTEDDIYNGLINRVYNNPQTALGSMQWTELHIRLGDFIRSGSDLSKGLKDITAIRISVNASQIVDLYLDSLWVGGASALDTTQKGTFPYNYVWRVRDPATRAKSNWSPPLRTGIKVSRGGVELNFPDANANYPANYRIDVARFGGNLSTFRVVGSILNDGSSFVDTSSDRLIADNDSAGRFSEQGASDAVFDFYKPFAILDTPKRGVANVIGTKFTWISGDKLNITYPRGTLIVINGKANRFYSNPITDTEVELETDMGALNNIKFEIEEPLLTGQALPVIFGPIGEGFFGLYIFGIGDKNAAGTIYWLDGNSPDTQSDLNRLEITSPSEPLVSGVIYDGYAFVWSTARSFTMQPTINSDGSFGFLARENANSRGLFCRTGIAVGPSHIYFLSENADGIYRVQGNGNPECITSGGLSNLFFNNGQAPKPITLVDGTIVYPPNFTNTDAIRFFCTNDYLFCRFVDTNGSQVALVYDIEIGDFISYDVYIDGIVNAFYKEELESGTNLLVGISNGRIGRFGTVGVEDGIISKVIPFAFDAGDSRLLKEFKELVVKADNGTAGFGVTNYYNNGDFSEPSDIIAGDPAHKRQNFILDIVDVASANKEGIKAENITSIFSWVIQSGVKLYELLTYFVPKGDEIEDRASDTEFAGDIGAKLWQGVVIRANTFGQPKTLNYYDDMNVLRATLIINHNGEQTISYSFQTPFISHTIKRTSNDDVNWIPMDEAYVFDKEPEAADVWEGEFNTHNLTGMILIERFGIAYRSDAPVSLKLFYEDGTQQIYNNILPDTNGEYNKEFFFAVAKKWKACKYRFESTNLRLYKRDSEVWMKSVGSQQPFTRFSPFGGSSRETEILI